MTSQADGYLGTWNKFQNVAWYIDTASDHPENGCKGTEEWYFRMACCFLIEDKNWAKQSKAILN